MGCRDGRGASLSCQLTAIHSFYRAPSLHSASLGDLAKDWPYSPISHSPHCNSSRCGNLKVEVESGRQLDQVLSRTCNDLWSQRIYPQGCYLKSKCPKILMQNKNTVVQGCKSNEKRSKLMSIIKKQKITSVWSWADGVGTWAVFGGVLLVSEEGALTPSPAIFLVLVTPCPGKPICLGHTRRLVNCHPSVNKIYRSCLLWYSLIPVLTPSLCHNHQGWLPKFPFLSDTAEDLTQRRIPKEHLICGGNILKQ